MKKILLLAVGHFIFTAIFSQIPSIKWSYHIKTYNDGEVFYDLKATPDNGYIAVGTDSAFGYDRSYILKKFFGHLGWIVKMDSSGTIQWQKNNKSGIGNHFQSVTSSTDGGYVAAGLKVVSTPVLDSSNLYFTKYSASGTQLWEKSYGGTLVDAANSIVKDNSGGYLIAGYTTSSNGDVSGNHSPGLSDVWLVRTDADGNIIWKKCFGGSSADTAFSVVQTSDKGFVIAGSSASSNGSLSGNNGLTDAWLFKIDSLGNLLWQKNYGGTGHDAFRSVIQNPNGTYTVTGYTFSAGAVSNGNKGKSDLWVANIAEGGTVIWSKGFGGTQSEEGLSVVTDNNNNYFVSGYTGSNDNDVSGNHGSIDAWLIKVSSDGNLVWQICSGSDKEEIAMAVVHQTEQNFFLGGMAQPSSNDDLIDGYLVGIGSGNIIKGLLYADRNGNGVQDNDEPVFNDAFVKTVKYDIENVTIPTNGIFSINVDTGAYVTSIVLPISYYTPASVSHNSIFTTYYNTDSFSVAIQPIPGQRDLVLNAVPGNVVRPGFNLDYRIFYKNIGTDTVTAGQILFKKDSRLNFISAIPAVAGISGDTLKWNYANLRPTDSATITIRMGVPPPPTVNINDTIVSMAVINPIIGDLVPSDDTAFVNQRVQGSYDPNDKADNLGGYINFRQLFDGSYINYVIRFQNTGTDTAFSINIRDTLSAKLDWNSLQMVAASHPYQIQINSGNRIVWYFNHILLPDSNRNEPASHGFIAYRIRPKNNLVVGDMISNSASIYFDFNPPVKTNTQVTTVNGINVVTSTRDRQLNLSSMILFPNPGNDLLMLKIRDNIRGKGMLSVIDINGRIILRKELGTVDLSDYTSSINLRPLSSGLYTVLLQVGNKIYFQKLILR